MAFATAAHAQGRVVLLVDQHSASAAKMIVAFASENDLATIVGEKRAGRLLSATSVKVGTGFRLALPRAHTIPGKAKSSRVHLLPQDTSSNSIGAADGADRQLEHALESLQGLPRAS